MKFKQHPVQRYFGGCGAIFLLIGLPILLSVAIRSTVAPEEENMATAFCLLLALCGAILINVGFLEKCFSTLILTDDAVHWHCPLRKDRVIPLAQCIEIGAYVENKDNGIPSEQIFFSDHTDALKYIGKNGAIKASKHLIKFYYSKQLCEYILKTYPNERTVLLMEYYKNRKDY